MASIIVALIIVLIVAIFSVQNAAPVSISFLFWRFQASLAIIIFLCVLSGIIVGSILTFLIRIKRQRKEKVSTLQGQREKDTIVR
jgi:putative membrane protein